MIDRKKTYIIVAQFSILIAILVALFSDASENMVLSPTNMGYLSSIVSILTIIQFVILIFNELKELHNLSYSFAVNTKAYIQTNLFVPNKMIVSKCNIPSMSHIRLQVMRC